MTDLETWIDDMSNRPLPGGVAASAVSAAMGAALIGKALRISLEREKFDPSEREVLSGLLARVRAEQAGLMRLAQEDVQAYRAVIATRSLPADDPARGRAWQKATEVPVDVAESCYRILDGLAGVLSKCWPGVCIDYQIGQELLQAGARAGRLAAQANLEDWGKAVDRTALEARVEALVQAENRRPDE